MNLITINGVQIKQPSQYQATISDVVNGTRNSKAVFIGQMVRHNMAKVEADFNYLTAQEWSDILQLFNEDYGGSFSQQVTFYDPVSMSFVTREMYVGDRTSAGAFMCDPNTGDVIGWKGVHLSLVEV